MSFAVPRSDRHTSGVGDFESSDVARNIGSLLRFGKVQSVDYENRLCRVELNAGLVTDDVPWVHMRAGGNTCWNAPSIGEAVLLISPSGELNNSVVMPALQSNADGSWPFRFEDLEFQWGGLGDPAPALWRWLFSDGALLENDPARHQFRVEQVQSRIRGEEICHLMSDRLVYIDGDHDQAIVHVKAPIIKLEGDVQITGQLLQGGRIVGTEPDGGGLKELQLVGDPIKLNGGGGVLGIAAGLLGSVAGGFALGTLGSAMGAFGGSLTGGLAGLATNVLGSTGLGTLASSLPISSIAGGLSLTGVAPVLGTVFNGLGFPGVTNIVQGVTTLVPGLTTGTGLSLTGAFQGLSGVASALGIPGTTDLTALGSIVGAIEGGTLGVNEMVDVLTGVTQVAGFTPPGEVNQILGLVQGATAAVEDTSGGQPSGQTTTIVPGPAMMANAADSIMASLYGDNAPASAEDVANMIANQGLASNYEALLEAGTNGGQLIGSFINDGTISLEQVLDMAGTFGGMDPQIIAGAVEGAAGTEKFWEHFERSSYKPGHVTPRDMSDASGSDTDPKGPVVPYNAYDDVNFEIMV